MDVKACGCVLASDCDVHRAAEAMQVVLGKIFDVVCDLVPGFREQAAAADSDDWLRRLLDGLNGDA